MNKLRSYFMGDFRTAFQDLPGLTSTIATLEHMKSINVILTYGGGAWDGHAFIPHQMRPILACSPMREDLAFYWWRAVSATYMTRPNQRALRVLNQLHGKSTLPVYVHVNGCEGRRRAALECLFRSLVMCAPPLSLPQTHRPTCSVTSAPLTHHLQEIRWSTSPALPCSSAMATRVLR